MMNWKYLRLLISLVGIGMFLNGCMQSDYTKLVKAELSKGVRQDSLLLGINFGDTRNDFYGKCFDLNKKQLVTQGPNNSSVQYNFIDSLVHDTPTPIRLLFYPSFDEDGIINEMSIEISYLAWAPWNTDLQSDVLKPKVKQMLTHWYKGNDFVEADVDGKPLDVKLDGNRRAMVYTNDTQTVVVKLQDILHPQFKHSISK